MSARHPDQIGPLFVQRANAGDVDGIVALYETDAVLATGQGSVAQGEAEIREFYRALLGKGVRFAPGRQQPALVKGDIALTSTMLQDGRITVEVARLPGRWILALGGRSALGDGILADRRDLRAVPTPRQAWPTAGMGGGVRSLKRVSS